MPDVMLDLETMGNGPNAAIAAIGAVEFDLSTGTIGRRFYRVVDLESAVNAGGLIDAATVKWWMEQSDDARKGICEKGISISSALIQFYGWIKQIGDEVNIWGNGAAFDNVVLAQAYRMMGFERPWNHWNDRCYRTIKAMHPDIEIERVGVFHNAADDAESQALHLIAMIGGNG